MLAASPGSAQRDPNPSWEPEYITAACGARSHPGLAGGISPGCSVVLGNAEGAGLEPPCSPGSGCKGFLLCSGPAGR